VIAHERPIAYKSAVPFSNAKQFAVSAASLAGQSCASNSCASISGLEDTGTGITNLVNAGPTTCRILIADDHPIFRYGVRALLESEPGFHIVGEATDGIQAVELVGRLKPDILLIDLAMPRCSGMDALRDLARISSPVRSVVLSVSIEREDMIEALQLGVRGIISKECATELLIKGVHAVLAGQYWVGHESVSNLIEALREVLPRPGERARDRNFGLTPREIEILTAVVAGFTNKDVAYKFSISEQTVKHHLTSIFDKLGVSNRLELALFAVNHHLAVG
jgi:two-component system, NarL family, nitrate/nitrite response regulator NarL